MWGGEKMVSSVTAKPNHYEVLGLASTASAEQIANAYAAQMRTFRLRPENALKRLAALSTAYETLRDPAKRRAYDQSLGVGAELPVREERVPFIAAAVLRPEPRPEPKPEPRPHVGSFIAESLRQPVRKTEPDAPPARAAEVPAAAPAEPMSTDAEESARRSIDRTQATIAAGLVSLAVLGFAIALPRPNADRLPPAAIPARQAVTVGLPAATAVTPAVIPQTAAPKSEAAAPDEQASAAIATPAREAPAAVSSPPDQQPSAEAAATDAAPATAAAQAATAPTQGDASAPPASSTPAPDAAATAPTSDGAKLPLANATIARTIERIGYSCGSVASTGAMDSSGVFQVTCSSGDSYQATPIHGRYHFRRLGSH